MLQIGVHSCRRTLISCRMLKNAIAATVSSPSAASSATILVRYTEKVPTIPHLLLLLLVYHYLSRLCRTSVREEVHRGRVVQAGQRRVTGQEVGCRALVVRATRGRNAARMDVQLVRGRRRRRIPQPNQIRVHQRLANVHRGLA